MNAGTDSDVAVAAVAAVIGEPARARMLLSLMDGRARTGTELGAIAEVAPSTASVHLHRLEAAELVVVRRQGRHRYYSLGSEEVARVLERLSVLAGGKQDLQAPRASEHLRLARSCYDHIAGTLGVALRERFMALGWLTTHATADGDTYEVSPSGVSAFTTLGIDLETARSQRRRFAYGCLDWTERRYHLGGSLGAALLLLARKRKWVVQDLDSRALRITDQGRRELLGRLGVPAAQGGFDGSRVTRGM
jgi:DNA-binding transcriptional ArsR family regulator